MAAFGSELPLRDCSKSCARAWWWRVERGWPVLRKMNSFCRCLEPVAGGASERPGRDRGAVQGGAREHASRLRALATMASAPRAPRPARPHSPGLVAQGFVAAEKGSAVARRGPRCTARRSRCCLVARRPPVLPPGRGWGVGQGLAREARRRCFAGAGVWRVFACRALNGATASAWPPPNSNAVVFEGARRKVSS